MDKRCFFFLLLVFLALLYVSATPQRQTSYKLVNKSGEDLLFSLKLKEEIRDANRYEYYNDGTRIRQIVPHSSFDLYREFTNELLPFKNSYRSGKFSNKYFNLIVFAEAREYEYVKDDSGNIKYSESEYDGELYPEAVLKNYLKFTGKEIFDILVEDFSVSDTAGNIILTLEDIKEYSFYEDIVEHHLEEYTDDFFEDPNYHPYWENFLKVTDDNRYSYYGLFITPAIVEYGRKKYMRRNGAP